MTWDVDGKKYHMEIAKANPYVLSGGSPGRIRQMAPFLDNVETVECERGEVTIHGTYKGLPVTAFSTGMGPASVSINLPEIIEACDDPSMVILRLGTSGALQKHLNIGDYVITTEVDRHENTCEKIMGKGYRAVSDPDVREALQASVEETKLDSQKIYQGRTMVGNELYFHDKEVRVADNGDILAISMEFSVYCALRDRYNRDFGQNIKVGNLLVVSDNLVRDTDPVDLTEFKERKPQIEEAHIKAGLETLLKMSQG